MAGKKTGKRLLTWVLVLVMALSLLPLNALAEDGLETDSSSGMIFTKQLVSDEPDNAGNYTIQMTAQATGKEVETTKVKPMDIVLVLDQSGSMKYKSGDGTRQSAMKEAVNSFIGEVAKKYSTNADHHMAIVTFDTKADILADWTPVDKDGEATLINKISGLTDTPSGATNVGAGMTETQSLMRSAPTGENRQKTVIVFTDGVPTTETDFSITVANTAIDAAKSMKNSGVTIYTVGIFNGAKPTQLHGDKWNYEIFEDVVCDGSVGSCWGGSWLSDLFVGNDFDSIDVPAGNRFLNYLSSNSKNADEVGITKGTYHPGHTGIAGGTGWRIDKNADWSNQSYYMTASDASSLEKIFEGISSTVPAPVNDKLDEKTVITDTLSDYFTFALTEDGKVDVKVYAIDANGNEKESADAANAKATPNGKTVTVTGYDFSAHYKGIGGDAEETLVIEIKVKPSGEGCTSKEIPTNDDDRIHAARVEVEVESEGETETKIVTSHKTAIVGGYSVEYVIGNGASWPNNSNGPETLYYPQGAAVPVTDSVPTRDSYEFTGWNTKEDGTGTTYKANGTLTITGNTTLYAQWKVKEYSFTVNYLWNNKSIPNIPSTTGSEPFGAKVTVTTTDIDGYTLIPGQEKSIEIGAGENVLTLNYRKNLTLTANSDSVTYDGKAHTVSGYTSAPDKGVTFGSVTASGTGTDAGEYDVKFVGESVVGTYNDLYIVTAVNPGKLTITEASAPTPGTFDFDDVVYGDGKNTPAITKTVKGNVGKNFKETFKVTVEPKSDNAKNTMTPDYYTGKAEVIASKSLKDVPFLFKPEAMANAVVPYGKLRFTEAGTYTYTVREIPGQTSRMSYDTTEYTLTIEVVLDENANTYQVKSWQFTAGNWESPAALNIVNTYRTYHPSTPSKPTLNTGDHYAYVMGYPDGTVRPNGSITRAEVSAILFRLLSDKTRDEYFTTVSSFTDVKAGAWYNNSIATLEKAGVIVDTAKGGAFRPNEAITRAELAAMLAQFSDAKPVKGVKFSDVSAEHWAYEAIAIAAKMGWIEGYPDGTFRPDATITRAEMMTLVNRALERVPSDEDHLLSKRVMLTFPDCKSGDWFYIAVQEATNSHTYERAATEKNGDEQWTALRANRDWTQLEK